jgi:6-pyruvoyltetrahydropterin/6-carboxytetrahydropterin synthase
MTDEGGNQPTATYYSTKTYGHDRGFSCAFRQWRAHDSHCRLVHGYSLGFKFVFSAELLDERNWVVDFGGLKGLKQILEDNFDHTTLVASDDPEIEWFRKAHDKGILRMVEVPYSGCERFAEMVFDIAETWLRDAGFSPRCRLVSVEVSEHGANSAIFTKVSSCHIPSST